MKKIIIYYGPKKDFLNKIPKSDIMTLSELVTYDDMKRKEIQVKHSNNGEESEVKEIEKDMKKEIINLVAYSESYAGITESAIQGFINILSFYSIENLYLQNPPLAIEKQICELYGNKVERIKCNYSTINKTALKRINDEFSKNVIGQENVKKQLLVSLYPLIKKGKGKPVVIMLYGVSGVGKTETAKFISKILNQELFRKQFSMFHSGELSSYIFGGIHSHSSFARDLLERESNVILLDEFDKPNSVFYSAFYQVFDEGIFEDKNYIVNLENSIIICTSNYKTEEEIRKHLGDPIFFRFQKFIKFQELSNESKILIFEKLFENKFATLSRKEKSWIRKDEVMLVISKNIDKFKNVRQMMNILEEIVDIKLVEKELNIKL